MQRSVGCCIVLTGYLEWERVVIPKTPAQESDIRRAVSNNFLFTSLDPEQMQIVVDAMFEKQFNPGDNIISQGDDGDLFYVLDKGECDCYVRKVTSCVTAHKHRPEQNNNPPIMVKHYKHGESFGELALMYNTKRAATIQVSRSSSFPV
jgi:cAMP-dependent protein kinase regulator